MTNTDIEEKELAHNLLLAEIDDKQIKIFLAGCFAKKIRILRNARRSILDSSHKEQATR